MNISAKTFSLCAVLFGLSAASGWAQGEAPGTVKATTKLRPDGSMSTTVLDPDKRTAEETFRDAGGKTLKKTVFNLNENNFAIGATYLDGKSTVRYKESYKLDGYNRVEESWLYSAANQLLGHRVFHYDAKNGAQVDDYDAKGTLISTMGGARKSPTVRRAAPAR